MIFFCRRTLNLGVRRRNRPKFKISGYFLLFFIEYGIWNIFLFNLFNYFLLAFVLMVMILLIEIID